MEMVYPVFLQDILPSFGENRKTAGRAWKAEKSDERKKNGIAIVAPGGYIPAAELQRGLETLKSQGYQVFNYYHPEKRYQRFAATDKERAAAN